MSCDSPVQRVRGASPCWINNLTGHDEYGYQIRSNWAPACGRLTDSSSWVAAAAPSLRQQTRPAGRPIGAVGAPRGSSHTC
ncbi:hypothetical protein EYF80_065769 [Liparis tanakae]|uniref:Uncharacterized protein n=1 Tax=Liparis tanakae TaxID=230148 RepID=A0A4Z2E5P5_9TELE|nr:hypothetical protein EYF80_065769 [Liparis tanakae]